MVMPTQPSARFILIKTKELFGLFKVENRIQPSAWDEANTPIVAHYSMNQDYQPFNMLAIAAELQAHDLFALVGVKEMEPMLFRQLVDGWIEAFHAANGFSRERMGTARAAEFDQQIHQVIVKYCPTGEVEQWIGARVIFGKPLDSGDE
jgi:hypothetical protein